MNIFTAAFLGFVQGITEFLPISSSAHLVFFQSILPGFTQDGVVFDIFLHVATTVAVLIYFRKRIFKLTKNEIGLLIIGSIPAAIIGIVFREPLEALFGSVFWAGVTLAISGVLSLFVDRATAVRTHMNWLDATIVGIAQAVAIIPGVSRSGATIFAGTRIGISRDKIAEYSFLLSIPAILGASVVQVMAHGIDVGDSLPAYLVGSMIAFVTAFLSIGFLLSSLNTRNYKYFGYYAIVVGVLAAVFLK